MYIILFLILIISCKAVSFHEDDARPAVAVDVSVIDADEIFSVISAKQRRVVVLVLQVVEILQTRGCSDQRQQRCQ